MKRFLKPLRVILALGCFLSVNAAFLAPVVAEAFVLDAPDFSWAAKMQFLPALLALNVAVVVAILVVTALVGRVYCSVVCPFGVLQDIAIRVRRLFTRRSARRGFKAARPTGAAGLVAAAAAILVLCAFGALALLAVCDPYSHYGRIATNLFRPAVLWVLNGVAAWGEAHEKYWLMPIEAAAPAISAILLSAATLVVIVALALWRGRWFCNNFCPVGACLRVASAKAPVRIRIDADKCKSCGMCERGCKAEAIDAKAKVVDSGRCVRCFNCLGACRLGAIKI